MLILIIILSLSLIGTLAFTFFLFKKINAYISKVESIVQDNLTLTENLKQTFRDILIDSSFLLDDGKLKEAVFDKEKPPIINGIKTGAKVEENEIGF